MAEPSITPPMGLSPPQARGDEPDPRQSLQHVLATEPMSRNSSLEQAATSKAGKSQKRGVIWIQEQEASVQNDSYSRAADVNPSHTMTVAHTRRMANGTIGSVYSGNKIKHLKKEDGIPLWRKDIQFAFLRAVFDDDTRVFTMASDASKDHTFAEIYIDAMARSSKTSKILKDKLLSDRAAALSMAMICLLVNVGRMNTTLNFFPEMRAQLRTYHSIPSLQAHQDPNAYKQLQDAPRLKSILKGASEDSRQPHSIEKVKSSPIPRTNPVNLIFILQQYTPKISETHFHPPRDFFDLVMRSTLSSRSRAKAFLWLIWFYLESDFTPKSAEENPFGKGQSEAPGEPPFKVPPFEYLTDEQADAENIDTQSEKEYGEMKRLERKHILEEDEMVGPPMKKIKKGFNDEGVPPPHSDTERSPSPVPPHYVLPKPSGTDFEASDITMAGLVHDISPGIKESNEQNPGEQPDSTNLRLVLKARPDHIPSSSPAMPPGAAHPTFQTNNHGHNFRRTRPQTSHQKAVDMNRKMRIDHILHQKLLVKHKAIRRWKKDQRRSSGYTAIKRIRDLPEDYDSEDERSWGPGGLASGPGEKEEFGEDALRHKKAIDRAVRRLERAENSQSVSDPMHGFRKRKRQTQDSGIDDTQAEGLPRKRGKGRIWHKGVTGERSRGHKRGEGLDDLDLDLLGESRDDYPTREDVDEDGGPESEGDNMTE